MHASVELTVVTLKSISAPGPASGPSPQHRAATARPDRRVRASRAFFLSSRHWRSGARSRRGETTTWDDGGSPAIVRVCATEQRRTPRPGTRPMLQPRPLRDAICPQPSRSVLCSPPPTRSLPPRPALAAGIRRQHGRRAEADGPDVPEAERLHGRRRPRRGGDGRAVPHVPAPARAPRRAHLHPARPGPAPLLRRGAAAAGAARGPRGRRPAVRPRGRAVRHRGRDP